MDLIIMYGKTFPFKYNYVVNLCIDWADKRLRKKAAWPQNIFMSEKTQRNEGGDIYFGHSPPGGGGIFVQIEKQGKILRRTSWKKEGKRGEKKKKEQSDKA